MAIDYSGLISEAGRAALSSVSNMPPDQRKAKMNDMLANGLLPFSVALAVDRQLTSPMKENAPSPRPGSVMSDKMAMLQNTGAGIDQLPVPSMDQAEFAGGGIVAFDGGGTTDMFSSMAEASPTHKRHGLWQFWKGLSGEAPPSEEDIRRKGQKERADAGIGNAASKYQTILQERQAGLDASAEEDRKAARKAGWLALAQAGLEGKGLIEGGVRGLAKNAEVMEAKNKERKAELRELQKEQYALELAMEQAKMAGNKQDYERYAAERDYNLQRQKAVAGGVQSMFELTSQEDRARLDRAAQAQKDSINVDFFNQRKALQARLKGATPSEAEAINAQIKALDEDWRTVNQNVGAASGYRADVGAESARAANLVKLMGSEVYMRVKGEADTALAAYRDPRVSGEKKQKLLDQYMAAQAEMKRLEDIVKAGGSIEGPTGPASAESALAGAGAPGAPMTGRSVAQPNDKYMQP